MYNSKKFSFHGLFFIAKYANKDQRNPAFLSLTKKQTYAHLGEFWSYTYHSIYLPYLAIAKFSNLKQMRAGLR